MDIFYSESDRVLSDKLYAMIRAALSDKRRMLIVVPAQASFLVESQILRRCGVEGFMDIEVASFEKLTERVASLAGGRVLRTIDSPGFAMLAKLAMMGKRLRVLDLQDAVLHEKVAELVAALKSEDISPSDVRVLAAAREGRIADKLLDIADIYAEMERLSMGSFFDARDMERFCASRFLEITYITEKEVILYGFDVLPKGRMETVAALAAAAKSTTLLMEGGKGGILDKQWRNIECLGVLLKEKRLPLKTCPLPPRPEGEVGHLWSNMYAYPFEKYSGIPENISLTALPSRRVEVENVAARILELACEGGLFLRDIAVVAGNPEDYATLIKDVFSRTGIAYFLQGKRPLLKSALATHVLSLLDIVADGKWRLYDVFSYLKAGFCCTGEEADLLIRYAREYGLRGYAFKAERKQAPEEWNTLRFRIFGPVLEFEERLKEGDLPGLLLEHLEKLGVAAKVEADAVNIEKAGFGAEARYLEQVYPALTDLIDGARILAGITPRSLRDVLAAGFSSKGISVVPPATDEVLVSDVTHSILGEKKVLFVLGANDGMLPVPVDESGIITDYEVQSLREDLPTFPDKMSFADQKVYIRKTLAAAERLHISYNTADGQPSYIVDRLKKLFPALEEQMTPVPLRSAPGSMDALAGELRESVEGRSRPTSLTAAYLGQEKGRLARVVERLNFENKPVEIGANTAQELYGGMRASVSRIESYYTCPYRHFIDYGLRPQEMREFEEDAASAGTYIHDIMDGFTANLARKGKNWAEISDEEIATAVNSAADVLQQEHNRGIFGEKRFRFTEKRLREEAMLAAKAVRAQLTGTDVRVAAGEAGFGGDIFSVPTAFGTLTVRGRIDRIDEASSGEKTYLRVVDYKTGKKGFDLTQVFYGVNLQLVVYLMAAESRYRAARKNVVPAGGFYFSIDLPYIEEGEGENARMAKFRMNGFILASYDAVKTLDASSTGPLGSMNAAVDAGDEAVKPGTNTFTKEEMRRLFRYTEKMVSQAAEEIFGGRLSICPLELDGELPCRYCEYASICMWDEDLKANRPGRAKRVEKEELFGEVGEDA